MPDQRLEGVRKGLRRRGRLLAQALKPPTGESPRPGGAQGIPRQPGTVPSEDTAADKPQYVAPRATRLVDSPVFVLSPVRSGSTLLRVLLNSHSRIRAPHEMHLRTLGVQFKRHFTAEAMRELELDRKELEHLLWDRVLDLELERTGKKVIVDKTPANTHIWRRLREAWPEAKFIFLLRHPGAIVTSLENRRTDPDREAIVTEVLRYARDLEEARQELEGITVTYERLTADPESTTKDICSYLGVEWEAGMLDYGRQDHGTFRPQMGDWSENIKSGEIRPARTDAGGDDLAPELAEYATAWGYGGHGADRKQAADA